MKKRTSKASTSSTKAGSSKSGSRQLYLHGNKAQGLRRGYDKGFKPSSDYLGRLPDIMDASDAIQGARVAIQQVGVSNFRIPLRHRIAGRTLELETRVTGTVSLEASQKGINMSRILRSFYEESGPVFTLDRLGAVLARYRADHQALQARIRLAFAFPLSRPSLRSGLKGVQYYDGALEGVLSADGRFRRFVELDFLYSSACPCSAELAEHARNERGVYAVPHSQRSCARVRVELAPGAKFGPEELWKLCAAALVTETQVLVKREDEQAFAELNGAHLKFVEDAARLLFASLAADKRIVDFRAACSHLESLHSHDAVSVICKGVPGGMLADEIDFRSLVR